MYTRYFPCLFFVIFQSRAQDLAKKTDYFGRISEKSLVPTSGNCFLQLCTEAFHRGGPATNEAKPYLVNRPGVAGAVHQTPLSFIHSFIN